MRDEPRAKPARRRWLEYGALAVAVLLAIGVGGALFLASGDGEGGASPEEVVRKLFADVAKGDGAAVDAALVVDARADDDFLLVPLGSKRVVLETKPAFTQLTTRLIAEQDGWASVGVNGTVKDADGEREGAGSVYLQRVDGRWRVSDQRRFLEANSGQTAPVATVATGDLGVLDPNRPKVGEVAPDFALRDARDGGTVRKLSDYRGKVVILNWYASWCGPCKREIPAFQAVYEALGDDVVVLGVNLEEAAGKAVEVLADNQAEYPALLDRDGKVAQHYRVTVMPTTYFIDREGVVRALQFGEVREADLVAKLKEAGVVYAPK